MAKDIPDLVRSIVALRSNGICELCSASRFHELHHRQPRGMGGTKRLDIHSPANLLALCWRCHHENVEVQRESAYEKGWLVRRGSDPAETRVWLHTVFGPGWYLLDDEGLYHIQDLDEVRIFGQAREVYNYDS